MSSGEEEENFCFFGKPLDPYDEDAIPKKRPISVEDQIATDAQGRRRFHGAFTGGFSAGFFNTVGTPEGWTPTEFKSTRSEKANKMVQNPVDFMDEEDLGEFGIAPQTIRATKDYSTSKKRRKQVFADGPIPGVPVLESILASGNETIGYLLLKKIGIKDKINKRDEELRGGIKTYGCEKPDIFKIPQKIEKKQYNIPKIYTENLTAPKSNTFGLGYKGLDKAHINLFTSTNLSVRDKNNKKFSIAGQAFGVGAFEEEDDDIYMKEDMSNYDFELEKEKGKEKKVVKETNLLFGMFKPAKNPLIIKKLYQPPVIPHSFTGKHKVKKSRFEPVAIKIEEDAPPERNQINPAIRAKYLGEDFKDDSPSQPVLEDNSKTKPKEISSNKFDVSVLMSDKFVSSSQSEDVNNILEPVKKSEVLHGTADMREAARMKMYGSLTRIITDWTPCALLCKRFNVPEPKSDVPELKNKKRTKNLIFENQKFTEEDNLSFKPGCSTPSTSQLQESKINIPEPTVKTEQMSPDLGTNVHKEESDLSDSSNLKNEVVTIKDVTEKIGIEEKEKIDLFKAVFLSSSESESEEDATEEKVDDEKKNEEYKETVLSELIPKVRPLKQGILSNITFQPKSNEPKEKIIENNANTSETDTFNLSYGPQIPNQTNLNTVNVNTKANVIQIKINSSDDEWVEKDSKNKHKKKKHKSKKKKHKHSKR